MAKKKNIFPQVVDKTEEEINQIVSLIQQTTLPTEIKEFIIKCIELATWLPSFILNTKISMSRFVTMIFGKGYKAETKKSISKKLETNQTTAEQLAAKAAANITLNESDEQTKTSQPVNDSINEIEVKKPGHGRMAYTLYKNCIEVTLVNGLKVGDRCPYNCGGKLYNTKPGHIIRVVGRPSAEVYHYTLEKLRCNLCLAVINPELPAGVGKEKYDAYFKSQLVLSKYYLGVPLYRQEHFQAMLGFPLSDATQWDLSEQVAGSVIPVFNMLKVYAGNGSIIHNDDTWIKILSVIKQLKAGKDNGRTGMYTTNVLSYYNGHKIALFLNGRKHSGENVAELLKLRAPEAGIAIQMCDALSANVPKGMQTILCNCLSHGVRKFKELVAFFPLECVLILKLLGQVFEYDREAKKMTTLIRLQHHQKYSGPIMSQLRTYISNLLIERKVEPNSEFGKALKYMLRHWDKLTRFLTVAGAPIDNNLVERALKIAIRNRKASMFYRSEYSAYIGGVLTSLIYTCHLANGNPQTYLTALQQYKIKVVTNPELFMPWNYQATIANYEANASQAEPWSQKDHPVVA